MAADTEEGIVEIRGRATAGEPEPVSWERALAALDGSYRGVTDALRGLDASGLAVPTRCDGWTRRDLLFHLLLDAQRALVTLATPDDGPPDTDYISYWAAYWAHDRSGDLESDPVDRDEKADAHARFVRAGAAAYRGPRGLFQHWVDTSEAAVRAARAAGPDQVVATQGRVLAVPDFLVTLAVEAAVHHLDLDLGPGADVPGDLDLVRRTLDGLLGSGVARPAWDDETYALKGTGRLPLDAAERAVLGGEAERFPLFA